MKKRIVSILLAAMMLFTLVALVGCGETGTEYTYSEIVMGDNNEGYDESMEEVYERAVLIINEDGTWKLSGKVIAFIKIDLFSGTYTVDDFGIYTFEGFEEGLNVKGTETEDGFELYYLEEEYGITVDFIIRFKKAE